MLLAVIGSSATPYSRADTSRVVSLSMEAAPVSRHLSKLTELTGIRLETSPVVAPEILVIAVREVPLRVLMGQIAKATSAEWEDAKEGFRLVRGQQIENQERLNHFRMRENLIRDAQARVRKQLDTLPSFSDDEARRLASLLNAYLTGLLTDPHTDAWRTLSSVERGLPAKRLAQYAATLLNPKTLALCDEPGVYTFSMRPTAKELQLPASVGNAVNEYNVQQQTLLRYFKPPIDGASLPTGGWPATHLTARACALIVVRVIQSTSDFELAVEVLLVDELERVIGTFESDLFGKRFEEASESESTKRYSDQPFELSACSNELLDVMRKGQAGVQPSVLSANLKAILTEPEFHDLNELVTSDLLLSLASQRQLNVVAAPEKNLALNLCLLAMSGKVTPSRLLDFLNRFTSAMETTLEGKWLVIRPSDPYLNRQTRLNERAHGQYIRAALRRNWTSIEETAELVSCNPRLLDSNGFSYRSRAQLVAPMAESPLRSANVYPLRLYGALAPEERAQLAGGSKLLFSRLSDSTRRELERIVFRSSLLLDDGNPSGGANLFGKSLAVLPTQRLRKGLPPNGTISMRTMNTTIIRCRSSGDTGLPRDDWSIAAVARHLYDQERGIPQLGPSGRLFTSFSSGLQRVVVFTLDFGGDAGATLLIKSIEGIGPEVKRAQDLPVDVWRQLSAEVARLRTTVPPLRASASPGTSR